MSKVHQRLSMIIAAIAIATAVVAEERTLVPCLRLAPAKVVLIGHFEAVPTADAEGPTLSKTRDFLILKLDGSVCVGPEHRSQSQFRVDEVHSQLLDEAKGNLGKRVTVSGTLSIAEGQANTATVLTIEEVVLQTSPHND